VLILNFKKHTKLKYNNFPKLHLKKYGIEFFSYSVHRIKIYDAKLNLVEKDLYIKILNKIVVIKNVEDVVVFNDYLYFHTLGKVKILFDCSSIFRYYNIKIISNKLCVEGVKQQSLIELINNKFQINFCKSVKKYINIIKNILKIEIFEKKLKIKPNNLKIPFILKYRVNNKIKRINVK